MSIPWYRFCRSSRIRSATDVRCPTATTRRMHSPFQRLRCSHLRSRYRATRSRNVPSGIAITTYPRATSVLVAYARIASVAVKMNPARRTPLNSSYPTPMYRGWYARHSISIGTHRTGSATVSATYGAVGSLGTPGKRSTNAITPAASMLKKSSPPANASW